MNASYDDYTRSRPGRGPAMYYGYCTRTNRYRMMDLPEYLSNVQEGMSRWMRDAQAMYDDMSRGYMGRGQGGSVRTRGDRDSACGCSDAGPDCHCECCVCDADVLVHARCGEVRRIPVTFENETRREKPVKLELEPFKTAGGRELGWAVQLSQSEFTLKPCDEQTVVVAVQVRCEPFGRPPAGDTTPNTPGASPNAAAGGTNAAAANDRFGSVDRCEVAYARLRADGCLIRPAVLAVAVLPDDCDAYRRSCGCGCCQ